MYCKQFSHVADFLSLRGIVNEQI